jgi:hypothetical protein
MEMEGIYNHPGDVACVDNVLICAAQNWPGGHGVTLNRYNETDGKFAEDAILFYDVSEFNEVWNPENPPRPKYKGKLKISYFNRLLNAGDKHIPDATTTTIVKVDGRYYLNVGDYWFVKETSDAAPESFPRDVWRKMVFEKTNEMKWPSGSVTTGTGSDAKTWGYRAGTDGYWLAPFTTRDNGNVLVLGPHANVFHIKPNATKAKQAEHGFYSSPHGYLTKVTSEAGFSTGGNDVLIVQFHSNRIG